MMSVTINNSFITSLGRDVFLSCVVVSGDETSSKDFLINILASARVQARYSLNTHSRS